MSRPGPGGLLVTGWATKRVSKNICAATRVDGGVARASAQGRASDG